MARTIARASGLALTEHAVAKWESGRSLPDPSLWAAAEDAYGAPPGSFAYARGIAAGVLSQRVSDRVIGSGHGTVVLDDGTPVDIDALPPRLREAVLAIVEAAVSPQDKGR